MATLVIRINGQSHPDPALDAACQRRGDVIEVVPDGWEFGAAELAHPDWRIVSMPAVSLPVARQFLGRGLASWEGEVAPARAFGLDPDHPAIPPETAAHLAGPPAPVHVSPMGRAELESARVARAPAPHPAVIGVNPRAIG